MVIRELQTNLIKIIGSASDTPVLDAKIILKSVTGLDNIGLIINKDNTVSEVQIKKAYTMAEKRALHTPMAYITGKKEFMSLDFYVKSGVLIPRPDTECIVEEAISLVKSGEILDIGSGSGAVAVSLAKYIPEAFVTALDVSDCAIETTVQNARTNGVDVKCVCCDIFSYHTIKLYDLIISNPPYIESDNIATLMSEVKDYEPLIALDGGHDGLMFYRRIAEFASTNLKSGGYLIFEFGWKQHDAVVEIIKNTGLEFCNTIYDLSGIKRGCTARKI